jgi:hypothetical protein
MRFSHQFSDVAFEVALKYIAESAIAQRGLYWAMATCGNGGKIG